MTPTAPPAASPLARGHEPGPASASAADLWRRWRWPLAIVALVLIGGTAAALLRPGAPGVGYLDPSGTGSLGTHALADLLAERGHQVIRTVTPVAAAAASGQGGATLLITNPEFLTRRQLGDLAQVPGHVVVVEPDKPALTALAPLTTLAGAGRIGPVRPDCGLAAAQRAGDADMGGLVLRPAPGISGLASCYLVNGRPSLVQYPSGGRLITLLGTGEPLTNESLGQRGNAALALNLLGTSPRIVWLVPAPAIVAGAGPSPSAQRPLTSLLPLGAYLVTIQLCIAVALAALWRARRLGPLVPERLPVVVRASETVEGHARLYQSRRARDRAAAALRTAMLSRVMPAVGLAHDAHPDAVAAALRARSALSMAKIEMILSGPAPGSDTALVTLADDLDALEREVRAQ